MQNPNFMKDINLPYGMELIQGENFVKTGSYNDYEQIFFSIEGTIQIKLIPHVYRQEVYAGQDKIINNFDGSLATPIS